MLTLTTFVLGAMASPFGAAGHPLLLLLDEPTAGMKQTETAEILSQLLELQAHGQTIVLVEPKMDLVMALSDSVTVMHNGKVIAEGPPAAIRHDEQVIEAYLGRRRRREAAAHVGVRSQPPPPTKPAPLLAVQHVAVFYGAAQALKGVSLQVAPGAIVSLLGGNASGKSTTMKAILGLLKPRGGACPA